MIASSALKLRQFRLAAAIPLGEVARRAGIPRTTLSSYESGKASPSPNTLAKWAAALSALAKVRGAGLKLGLAELEAL